MKTKRFLLLITLLILLCTTLVGCSLFTIFSTQPQETSQLASPKSISISEDGNSLSWSIVPNASSYKICFTNGAEVTYYTSETNTFTIPSDLYGEISVKVCAVSSKDKFTDSKYSQAFSISFYGTLELDLSTFANSVKDGVLTVNWEDVENADNYLLKLTEGNGEQQNIELNKSEYSVTEYNPLLRYEFVITAGGSGWFKNSAPAKYVKSPVADFTNAIEYPVDKLNLSDLAISFSSASAVKINGSVYTADCSIQDSEVIIGKGLLDSLDVGSLQVILENSYSVKTLYIELSDNRVPTVTIAGAYTKDGNSIIGGINFYNTTYLSLQKSGSPIAPSDFSVTEDSITLPSTYLDSLPNGKHNFELLYKKPNGETENIVFSVTVSSAKAVLLNSSYDFYGMSDLDIDIKTNGDTVTSVQGNGKTLKVNTDYVFDKNTLTIKSKYLSENACASISFYTTIGGKYTFTIAYKLDGFVPSSPVYLFDKNSSTDLSITGVVHKQPVIVYGNMLTQTDYAGNGNNGVIMSRAFLSKLSVGEHEFMALCDNIYSYFNVNVTSESGSPSNVIINTDFSSSETYLCFECECGDNRHLYSLDNGSTHSCQNMQQLYGFDRAAAHTLTVSCSTYGTNTTINYDKPADSALPYINSRFSFDGEFANKYIESVEELSFLLRYLSYGGDAAVAKSSDYPQGFASEEVYFSESFNTYARNNGNYFNNACSMFSPAWSCQYSLRGKENTSNVCIISASFNSYPEHNISSGTTPISVSDTRTFLSKGNRSSSFNGFAINNCSKSENVTTSEELSSLSFGVKPSFSNNNAAKQIYNAALDICRTYISSDMTDFEKLTTIYHWITTNITYDDNALVLYNVKNTVCGANYSLDSVLNYINGIINSNPSLSDILSPLMEMDSTQKVQSGITDIMARLRAFTLEGALLDNVAVCDGIASTFRLLCLIEGIECIKVSGTGITNSGSENHAWNKVLVNDEWYIVDATWGRSANYVNHKYFLITEEEAISSHIENSIKKDETYVAVVDIIARGSYNYMANQIYNNTYDMIIEDENEFRTVVNALKNGGETVIELRIDFTVNDIADLIRSASITCSYLYSANYLTIILS